MREIVLDTETTGFDPESGDRIVEIGAVELWNHMATGETYHVYINPERSMPEEAFGVHGIGPDLLDTPRPPEKGEVTLKDKPVFAKVGQGFLDFIQDSKLVIHNASFDMKFLNAELRWMGLPQLPMDQALDTLAIARKRIQGSPASLDALCRRFGSNCRSRTVGTTHPKTPAIRGISCAQSPAYQSPDPAAKAGDSSISVRHSGISYQSWHCGSPASHRR